jgi:hypothetical protein
LSSAADDWLHKKVISSDRHDVGNVDNVDAKFIRVMSESTSREKYDIPRSEVATVEGDKIILKSTYSKVRNWYV